MVVASLFSLTNCVAALVILGTSGVESARNCVGMVRSAVVPKYTSSVPNAKVDVVYRSGFRGECNALLSYKSYGEISLKPTISKKGKLCNGKNITIIMVDIDGGFPSNSSVALEATNVKGSPTYHDSSTDNIHNLWLVSNIKPKDFRNNDLSKANEIYKYLPPSKIKTNDMTTHTVVTFLQCQDQYVDPSKYSDNIEERRKFNMRQFTSSNQQEQTRSAQLYRAELPIFTPPVAGPAQGLL